MGLQDSDFEKMKCRVHWRGREGGRECEEGRLRDWLTDKTEYINEQAGGGGVKG